MLQANGFKCRSVKILCESSVNFVRCFAQKNFFRAAAVGGVDAASALAAASCKVLGAPINLNRDNGFYLHNTWKHLTTYPSPTSRPIPAHRSTPLPQPIFINTTTTSAVEEIQRETRFQPGTRNSECIRKFIYK